MNRTLIAALNGINNVLAFMIIAGFAIAGYVTVPNDNARIVMGIIGLVAGLIVAAIVCGFLAIAIEIEKHVRQLVAIRRAEVVQVIGDQML